MFREDIVLCHPVRTAIGAFNGSLRDWRRASRTQCVAMASGARS
jgi:hypothetical protein